MRGSTIASPITSTSPRPIVDLQPLFATREELDAAQEQLRALLGE